MQSLTRTAAAGLVTLALVLVVLANGRSARRISAVVIPSSLAREQSVLPSVPGFQRSVFGWAPAEDAALFRGRAMIGSL